ncbi:diguanylate cyclase [Acidovorax sp. WCS2018Noco2-16]|uniref:diguanylate cyclase n=1 Tax=Acidovorax sp. WCS2018Noco2-16 TaxID=3073624 RepID=UPI002882F249|nr:diguanylate cyclase [Acidovorax sp. WCS2018Noco2-16]
MPPVPGFARPGQSFAGYEVGETLYQGPRSVVLRCRQVSGPAVIVKLLRCDRLGPGDVARFRREYELSRRVPHERVVSATALGSHDGVLFITMPDDGATALREWLRQGPLPIAQALDIALAVVDALEAIHVRNIVHKDVAPGNIIARPGGVVRLIDFGIAASVSVERTQAVSLRELEGTLATMAPEQTGRMNRDLDYRADFYALGATLYELLTGAPPFGAIDDPLRAVHAHLALMPPPLQAGCPQAPAVLGALVDRLLAKEPESRYQSHHVLRRDLQRIRASLNDPAALQGLVLAQGDLSERFHVAGRLYGRAPEVRQLLAAFDAAAGGAARLVTLDGAPGVGKTALVQEVQRTLLARQGQMASGKFNQFGQPAPCAAFVQALAQRTRQLLALPPAERAVWGARLQSLLGANSALAQSTLPELVALLEPAAPDEHALGPMEAENRFVRTMQLCFAGLCSADSPLLVFIDDLQWSDRLSRRLLREMVLDDGLQHLLVIGAYRADEVGADHPLAQDLATLAAQGDAGGRHLAMRLDALTVSDAVQWLADALQRSQTEVQPLAQLCYAKTGGNPFFLGRFLHDLHQRGLIWLDRAEPRWSWDNERIRHEHVADNVVALMLEQLRRLPPDTRTVLATAACLGSRFDPHLLGVACARTTARVAAALHPALEAGLVVPRDARYKWLPVLDAQESQGVQAEFAFAHDRVQEAAYLLSSELARPALHLHIGRLLRDARPGEQPDFAVVNHLNLGQALVQAPAERAALAGYNARASVLACEAASFDLAAHYAAQAVALRGAEGWHADAAGALELHVHAARMAALTGSADIMDALIDTALPHAATPMARARLLDVRIESFYALGRLDDTLELGLSVLQLLGAAPPEAASPADAVQLVTDVRAEIEAIGFDALAARPAMTDALCLQQLSVVAKMTAAAYIARPALLPLLTVLQVRLMVAHGHAPVALSAYSVMGLMVAEFLQDYPFGYRLGRLSMDLVERHGWRHVHAHAGFSFNAFLRHWIEGLASGLPGLMSVHRNGLETGNLRHAGLGLYVHGYHALLAGMPLADLETQLEADATTLRRIRQPVAHDYLGALLAVVRALRRPMFDAEPLEQQAAGFSARALEQTYADRADQTGAMFLHAWHCMLHALAGRAEEAVAAGDAAQALFAAGRGMAMVPFCVFFSAMSAPHSGRPDAAQRCKSALHRLELWAHTCADVRPLAYLLRARMAAFDISLPGPPVDVQAEIDAAQRAAQTLDNLFVQGLVHWSGHQDAAPAHLADAAARAERAQARALFLRWGAVALAGRIEEPRAAATDPSSRPSASASSLPGGALLASPGSALDLSTLMKAVQAVTAEIALDALLNRLLQVLRESAGASRAAVVLSDGTVAGAWSLRADSAAPADAGPDGTPLEDAGARLPLEVLRTVLHLAAPVLIPDVLQAHVWRRLPYFSTRSVRSVLCVPLVRLGSTMGALYLENDAMAGVFSQQRIQFLELLSGNVVNAIDNARLYAQWRGLAQTLEQRVAERTQALAESESRLMSILHNAPLPMLVTNVAENRFVYVNERAAHLSGMPMAELMEREPRSLYRNPGERDRMFAQYRRDGVLRDYETSLLTPDGRELWVLVSMVPVTYDGAACALATIVDITERKAMEDALRVAATTDALTGTASRRHFMERSEAAVAQARRAPQGSAAAALSMVMFDVDDFKLVNDRHGHAAGDAVLRAVTAAAVGRVRAGDLVGRLGGEEFGILLPATGLADAVALAQALRAAVAAVNVPVGDSVDALADVPAGAAGVQVTASFGVSTLAPCDTLDTLLARADGGLYQAKHQGRNRVNCLPTPQVPAMGNDLPPTPAAP